MKELSCDICGRPAIAEAMVEGARLFVCPKCASYGRLISRPRPPRSGPVNQARPQPVVPELELVEDYAAVIKKAREAQGLSLKDLGQKLGIREQELLHMEEGKLKPPEKDSKKLEAFLKIKLLLAAVKEPEEKETPEDLAKKLESMKRSNKGGAVTLADMVEIKVKKA